MVTRREGKDKSYAEMGRIMLAIDDELRGSADLGRRAGVFSRLACRETKTCFSARREGCRYKASQIHLARHSPLWKWTG
jgi:hypothetical protein